MFEQLREAIIVGDDQAAPRCVSELLQAGVESGAILNQGLLPGMTEVGRRFRDGDYFIPDVLVAAEAMKAAMAVLRPRLTAQGVRPRATAVVGTVRGDLHDIGKSLLATMLEGAGFEVIDLGVDVPAERFVEACRERPVQLVGLSALLTTTMPEMQAVVRAVRDAVRPSPWILVGGAPLTQAYADHIGADGYGRDAATGAELARRLCLTDGDETHGA